MAVYSLSFRLPGCQSLCSSTRLSVSLFVYPPVSLSVRLPACQSLCSSIRLSVSVRLPACQSLCPSTRLPISLSVYPPANLSAHLPACQSLCPSTRLPISLPIYPPANLSVRLPPVRLYSLCLSLSHCLSSCVFICSPDSLNSCPLLQREHLLRKQVLFFVVFTHLLYAAFV